MLQRSPIYHNPRGQSLISVLVALSMAGVLGVMILKTNEMGLKGAKEVENRVTKSQVQNLLVKLLSDGNVCTNTLGGTRMQTGQEQEITEIKDETNQAMYIVSNQPELMQFGLRRIYFPTSGAGVANNWQWTNNTNREGQSILRFIFDKPGRQNIGGENTSIDLTILATLDNQNRIQSCTATGGSGRQLWQEVAGTDHIYYDRGNVGVGTNNPTHPLQVNGNAVINGSIQLAIDLECSNNSHYGKIRYNPTSDDMEFCSAGGGTPTWRPITRTPQRTWRTRGHWNGVHGSPAVGDRELGGCYQNRSDTPIEVYVLQVGSEPDTTNVKYCSIMLSVFPSAGCAQASGFVIGGSDKNIRPDGLYANQCSAAGEVPPGWHYRVNSHANNPSFTFPSNSKGAWWWRELRSD